MKKLPRASASLLITAGVGITLIVILLLVKDCIPVWFPQFVITLSGLVGASWFVGNRLDLLDKDIDQRQAAADAQLISNERANFNSAIKEAVQMMSNDSPSSVLAGQRWLHAIADVGPAETRLVQSLLCAHVTNVPTITQPTNETGTLIDLRQSALNLLFHKPDCERYNESDSIPDLSSTLWEGFDFTSLNLRESNFYDGDFTNAIVVGACLDHCDLRKSKWHSDVGGDSRTFMKHAHLCGVTASSNTFFNVDFTKAKLCNNGYRTQFRICTFEECNFTDSDWTGATFENCRFIRCNFEGAILNSTILDTPGFDGCPTATSDILRKAKLKDPAVLRDEVVIELRNMGLLN